MSVVYAIIIYKIDIEINKLAFDELCSSWKSVNHYCKLNN